MSSWIKSSTLLLIVFLMVLSVAPVTDAAWPNFEGRDLTRQAELRNIILPLAETGRPRLLLNDEVLAEVRQKIANDDFIAGVYNSLRERSYSSGFNNNMWVTPKEFQGLAFTYLVENRDPALLPKCLSMVQTMLNASTDGWTRPLVAVGLAFAYDWLYEELGEDLRQTVANKMLELGAATISAYRHSDYNNHVYRQHNLILFVGLALYGEDTVNQSDVEQIILDGAEFIIDHALPTKIQVSGNGDGGWQESPSYHAFHTRWMAHTVEALSFASGINYWEDFNGLDGDADWLYQIYCPNDGSLVAINNHTPNQIGWEHAYYLPLIQSRRNSPVSAALIHDLMNPQDHNYIREVNAWYLWPIVLWYDPEVQPAVKEELPLSDYFSGIGWVTMRSSWDEDATFAVFHSGPIYSGHQHMNQNSFVIHKMGNLAITSRRTSDQAPSINAKSTFLHNTVLIGSGQREYGNDPRRFYGPTEGTPFDTGEIVTYTTNEYYTYAIGDATKAHDENVVLDHTRHFLYLRPDTFVILDRAETVSNTTPKVWLLNSWSPAEQVDDNLLNIQDGDGSLWVEVLLPTEPDISFTTYRNVGSLDDTIEQTQVRGVADNTQYFLHVLTAGASGDAAPDPSLVVIDDSTITVQLTRDNLTYTVTFYTTEDETTIGGNILIVDDEGNVIMGETLTAPVASFTTHPNSEFKIGEQIQFTDTSVSLGAPITQWSWDFGDGNSSNEANPTHIYTSAGVYKVSLEVTNDQGKTSHPFEKELYVGERGANYMLYVDSTYDPTYLTSVIHDGIVDPTGTTWASKENTTEPHWVEFQFDEAQTINFATIHWAFNNGSQKYMTSKTMEVQVWNGDQFETIATMTTDGESVAESSVEFDVVTTERLRFFQPVNQGFPEYSGILWLTEIEFRFRIPPVASIAEIEETPVVGDTITLDGTGSTGEDITYSWSIKSKPQGSQAEIVHADEAVATFVADSAGWYVVELTVNDSYEEGTTERIIPVMFSYDPQDDITTDTTIQFQAATDEIDGAWSWDLGDGTAKTEPNPTHQYAMPGVYHVSLVVTDDTQEIGEPLKAILVVGTTETPVEGIVSQNTQTGVDTVNAKPEANVEVIKHGSGTPTITVVSYGGNPAGEDPGFRTLGEFFDLNLDSADDVESLELRWYFDANIDADEVVLKWFDQTTGTWLEVIPQSIVEEIVNPYVGYISATLDDDSSPGLDQLTGTYFAAGVPINQPPVITLLSPSAGDIWSGHLPIKWSASDPDGDELTIRLRYSDNAGTSWNDIELDLPNTGNYLWGLNELTAGDQYQVRVIATDPSVASASDTSDNFTVVKAIGGITHGPNPASDSVTFYIALTDAEPVSGRLIIFNLAGQIVWEYTIDPGDPTYVNWDLTNQNHQPLADGLYLYFFLSDSGEKSDVKQLVIER